MVLKFIFVTTLTIECNFREVLTFTIWTNIFHSFFPFNQAVHMKLVIALGYYIDSLIQADTTLFLFIYWGLYWSPL